MSETFNNIIALSFIFSFFEGCRLSEWDGHNQAISCYNKAISLKPEVVKHYIARGESYLQICDFQSAILNFKKACILDPDNDQTYSRLAFLYFLQGQCLFDEKLYGEALESFSRAAEMKPEVIGYHTRRFGVRLLVVPFWIVERLSESQEHELSTAWRDWI